MKIKFDYHSSEPLYRQAVQEIKRLVVSRQLKPGDKLPSVRAFAEQLQLNATTIRRIFDQLAGEGVVIRRHGSGVFISDSKPPFSEIYARSVAARLATTYLVEGLRMGLDYDELRKLLDDRYRTLVQEETQT